MIKQASDGYGGRYAVVQITHAVQTTVKAVKIKH